MDEEEITSGLTDNERENIRDVLHGTYTPLINAIIHQDIDAIKDLLENKEDPNEKDSVLHWCPLKWAQFLYTCNEISHDTLSKIVETLYNSGAEECFDENTSRDGTYNFSPIILEEDEKRAQLLREIEEEEDDTILGGERRRKRKTLRRKKMTGGRRETRRKQSRKHKKAKKSRTKRRKPMKK